jgi:hypothetical protein
MARLSKPALIEQGLQNTYDVRDAFQNMENNPDGKRELITLKSRIKKLVATVDKIDAAS